MAQAELTTRRASHSREHGYSLVELLAGVAVFGVIAVMAGSVFQMARTGHDFGYPEAKRIGARTNAYREIQSAASGGANLLYFDSSAAYAAIRGGGSGGGGGTGGPPEGYCLVDMDDESTWPPGFDPRDQSTWSSVPWWDGVNPNDPSTYWYDCGGKRGEGSSGSGTGGGSSTTIVTGSVQVPASAGYGTGVRARELPIVGPVAVWERELAPGQQGPVVATLRTEPGARTFRLAGSWESYSGVIRLVARDEPDREAVEALQAEDILWVNGLAADGSPATALAQLTEVPRVIAMPTPIDADGRPVYTYYEARVLPPSSTFRFGLQNSEATSLGVTIRGDATVVLLDRAQALVCFYTRENEQGGQLSMVRAVGDPSEPLETEVLVAHATAPLSAALQLAGAAETGVLAALPVARDATDTSSEPLRVAFELPIAKRPHQLELKYVLTITSYPSSGGGK